MDKKVKDLFRRMKRETVPKSPVAVAKMALKLAAAATEGPWHACNNGECSCKGVGCADHPIADVTVGAWGDNYPSIRLVGESLNQKAEAYMEQITYGEVSSDAAKANARLIAFARTALPVLAKAVIAARAK